MYLSTVVHAVIKAICDFSHNLGDIVVLGFATSHSASIEAGEGKHCLFNNNSNNNEFISDKTP